MSWRTWALSPLLCCLACSDPGPAADAGTGGGSADAATDAACSPIVASTEPTSLQNDYGTLGGVLEIPAGGCTMPVVLILSGSGSTDRDGNTPGSPQRTDVYSLLGQALRDQAGVATLRYDDHGIGASTSGAPQKVEDFSFETEVEDASRWIERLRSDPRFDRVVVAGHSQGSLTAILAGKKTPIDGFISLAGAGRRAGELLHDQLKPKLTPAQLAELDAAIDKLEAGELTGPLASPLDQILPANVQPYLISWFAHDPKPVIATVTVPTLLVQGKTDVQVSLLDASLLHEAKPDATLALIDDMSHPLKQATSDPSEQKAAYGDPSVPLAVGLMPPIKGFLASLEAH